MSRFSPDRDLSFVGGKPQMHFWRLIKGIAIIIFILYVLGSV